MANTSLAQQLKRLATPQTSLFIHKKKRLSFLFDPSEAASISRETFYEIGISGLEELIRLNSAFEEFRSSLFDKSSIQFERAVETLEKNELLNCTLRTFLHLISPYFLLSSSHKAIEWLIVRFHVNEYNANELLMMAMPFHSTRLFARLLQVVELKNQNENWDWLYPLQRKGVPLSSNAICNRCVSDAAFLKMICETVQGVHSISNNSSGWTTVFNFYAVTMVGSIDYMDHVSEPFITNILPTLLAGLKSQVEDYTAASLVIIGKLLTKTSFNEKLLKRVIIGVSKIAHESMLKESVIMLHLLKKSNTSNIRMPKKAVANLMKRGDPFVLAMKNFLSTHSTYYQFYVDLIGEIFRKTNANKIDKNDARKFLTQLFVSVSVCDEGAKLLIKTVMEALDSASDEWCYQLLKMLENQYPLVWDDAISNAIKVGDANVGRVLGLTRDTKDVNLLMKLNDVVPQVRIEAINFLAENPSFLDVKYVDESLRARWDDTDASVIAAMFKLPRQCNAFSLDIAKKLIIKCWHAPSSPEWDTLLTRIVANISPDVAKEHEILLACLLMPFVVARGNVRRQICCLPINVLRELKDCETNEEICESLMNILRVGVDFNSRVDDLLAVAESLLDEPSSLFCAVLLLGSAMRAANESQRLKILNFAYGKIFISVPKKINESIEWENSQLIANIKKARSKFPRVELMLFFTNSAIRSCSFPQNYNCAFWMTEATPNFKNAIAICNHAIKFRNRKCVSVAYNRYLEIFFASFSSAIARYNFACSACLHNKDNVGLYLTWMEYLKDLMSPESGENSLAVILSPENIIVPSLLVGLSSNEGAVRLCVTKIVDILSKSGFFMNTKVTFVKFLTYVCQYNEEMVLDSNQIAKVASSFFLGSCENSNECSSSFKYANSVLDVFVSVLNDERTPISVATCLVNLLDWPKKGYLASRLSLFATKIIKARESSESSTLNSDESAIVGNVIDRLGSLSGNDLEEESIWKFIQVCLRSQKCELLDNDGRATHLPVSLLKFIANNFDDFASNAKNSILKIIFDDLALSDIQAVRSSVSNFVKKISIDARDVEVYLKNMAKEDNEQVDMVVGKIETIKNVDWRRGVAVMELLQDKKKITSAHFLVKAGWDVLRKCHLLESSVPLEYEKQLCVACVLNCVKKINPQDFQSQADLECWFHLDSLMLSVQFTRNALTIHHIFEILTICVELVPRLVMFHIMSILSYLGPSLLVKNDDFSFQASCNIVENIVPLLVSQNSDEYVSKLLNVFALNLRNISGDRRIPLLEKVIVSLGVREYLSKFIAIVLELEACAREDAHQWNVAPKKDPRNKIIFDTLYQLPFQFGLSDIVACCWQLLERVKGLPHEKNALSKTGNFSKDILSFDANERKNHQLLYYKYLLLTFISSIFTNKKFIFEISSVRKHEWTALSNDLYEIVENIIIYVESVAKYKTKSKFEFPEYWGIMITLALEILDEINALLTGETFLLVAANLLKHEALVVRRKALQLLTWRLQNAEKIGPIVACKPKDMIELLPTMKDNLVILWDKNARKIYTDDKEVILTQHELLICVGLLAKCCAYEYVAEFKEILEIVSAILYSDTHLDSVIISSLFLTISEFVVALKIHAIEHLSKFLPAMLKVFNYYRVVSFPEDIALVVMLKAVEKIVQTLPNFISPFMETILQEICVISSRFIAHSNAVVIDQLSTIRNLMSEEIPDRVLLPAATASFNELIQNGEIDALVHLVSIVTDSYRPKTPITSDWKEFLMCAIDFRNECSKINKINDKMDAIEDKMDAIDDKMDAIDDKRDATKRKVDTIEDKMDTIEDKRGAIKDKMDTIEDEMDAIDDKMDAIEDKIDAIEESIISNVTTLVMKCSEAIFRPFFFSLCDWAVPPNASMAVYPRTITFFRFTAKLSEKLKGIFAYFASKLLKLSNDVLEKNSFAKLSEADMDEKSSLKSVTLIDAILSTLRNLFKYKKDKMIEKSQFKRLCDSLLDQLENTAGDFEKRRLEILSPCLAYFGAATSDDSLWKEFNYRVLLKMRHENYQVRLAALDTVCQFSIILGDNFLPFLPESVPFLAEMLEDENEIVEKRTREAIVSMEQTLGEQISKYF